MSTTDVLPRVLISIAYFCIVFISLTLFQQKINKKYSQKNKHTLLISLFGSVIATLPNCDIIILNVIRLIKKMEYPLIYIETNTNVWSHSPILIVILLFTMIVVGIGKWEKQIVVQSIIIGLLMHFMLDFIFYGLPINFLVPFAPFETMEFGFSLAYIINNYMNISFLMEIIILIISIILVSALTIKLKRK